MTRPGPTTTAGASPAAGSAPHARRDEQRELDHRLANSLQLAADFLIFEHSRIADAHARAALVETAERLSAVGQMHRFLASRHGASGVDLDPFFSEFGKLIAETTGLHCSVESDSVSVPAETAQQLAIAVNELAMNAAKHAYPWGHRGALYVVCRRRGETLVLVVSDDGQGLGKDFDMARDHGLGMTILSAIVRQLRGTFHAVSDNGARFTITLPLPPSPARAPRSFSPPNS